MLYWIIIFAILSIVAATLGFGGIASVFASIAQVLFFIFLGIVVLLVIVSISTFKRLKRHLR